jgi:phage portal protein BeeE
MVMTPILRNKECRRHLTVSATYANYREASRALFRLAILPLAGKLLDAIGEGLRAWFPGATLTIDLDAVGALAEDRERLWAQVSAADFP